MRKKSSKLFISLWLKVLIISLIVLIPIISSSKIFITKEVEQDVSLREFTGHLDQRIPELMNDYDIPGLNIALIKGEEVILTRAYGYANLAEGHKMTVDTLCRVESISKSVTAWGVMKLVEEGRMDLNKSVKQYIKKWQFPESEFNEEKITAKLLLSNTAGLPLGTIGPEALYFPGDDIPSLEKVLSEEVSLIQEPGKSFYYSDTGFNSLELLVEEVSGRDFADYMKDEILLPLGMYNSSYVWSEKWDPPIPTGYDVHGRAIPVYTYSLKASGNLYATVQDIATFVSTGMFNSSVKNSVLTKGSIKKIYQPVVDNIPGYYGLVFDAYGSGHYIEWFSNGAKSVLNGGQGTGWMSYFQSVPETGDGIVILTNSQRSWPAFAYILSDWTAWLGFSSAGMELIITGQKILWILTAFILFIVLWKLWDLFIGLITGKLRFDPAAEESRVLRLIQAGVSVILFIGVYFAVNMEYQPLYSIFPIGSHWFFNSLFFLAAFMFVAALFPSREKYRTAPEKQLLSG